MEQAMTRLFLLLRDSRDTKLPSYKAAKQLLTQQPKPAWWTRLNLWKWRTRNGRTEAARRSLAKES